MSHRDEVVLAADAAHDASIGKRAFDLIIALAAMILLFPLFLVTAMAIAVQLGWPVFYLQERTGKDRRSFQIVKFRSMLKEHDNEGNAIPDELRLTAFGRWLRAWSLDELPSLWNILRGEMSIVGPRPLIHHYNEFYSAEQARRFLIRPGITGWAQVNGRNSLSWEEKFQLDVWYVENYSFLLDLRILISTVLKVLRREAINADGHATMPRFNDTLGEP